MKKILLALLLLGPPLYAQHRSSPGTPFGATLAIVTNGQCQVVSTGGTNSAMFAVTGTWTGTLGFFGTNDLGVTTVALQAYPVNTSSGALGSSSVNTTTGNGVWIADTFGMYQAEICATAAMTGSALIRLDADPAVAVMQVTGIGGAAIPVTGSLSVSGAADVVSTGAPTTFNANTVCTGALLTAGLQSAGFHFDVGTLVGTFTAQCSAFVSGTTNFTNGGLKDVTGATVSGAVTNPNAQTDWTITCPGDTRRVQVCTTAFTSGSTTGQAVGTFYQTASAAGGGGGGVVTQPTGTNLHTVTDATSTTAATQSGTWTVQPGNTANTTAWKVDGSAAIQPVSESGTWTVQPGNTANTTPWLFKIDQTTPGTTNGVVVNNTANVQGLGAANAPSGGVMSIINPTGNTAPLPVKTFGTDNVASNAADHPNASVTLSTACVATTGCATTAVVSWFTNGLQSGGFDVTAISVPVGFTLACDQSLDALNYVLASCSFRNAVTGAQKQTLANADLTASSKWVAFWDGSPQTVQIRVSAVTSGSITLRGNATFGPAFPPQIAHNVALGMPQDASGNALSTPVSGADQTTATTPRTLTFATASTSALATAPAAVVALSPNPSTVCTTTKPISQTTSTDLLTSTNKLHICSIVLVSTTAQSFSLVEGTGVVCATGIAAVVGATTAANGIPAGANSGFVAVAERAWLRTATTGDHLCLLQSGAGLISGVITVADAP